MRSLLVGGALFLISLPALGQQTAPPTDAAVPPQPSTAPPTSAFEPALNPASSPAPVPFPATPPLPPPPPPPPPPPNYGPQYGSPVPCSCLPPSTEDPTAYRHDGLYLRFGVGPGYGRVVSSGAVEGTPVKGTLTGWGPAEELLIGGTLGHGIVVGGAVTGTTVSSPKVSVDGKGVQGLDSAFRYRSTDISLVGPFIDWFPDPGLGAHVGGMVGIGTVGLNDSQGGNSTGFGGSLWGGYDFWIAKQWSLGAEVRGMFVAANRDVAGFDGPLDDHGTGVQFLFTALHH